MVRDMVDVQTIPELLRRSGKRQADLARHLALDPSSMSKLIRGARQLKAIELAKIEEFFAMAMDEVVADRTPGRIHKIDGASLFRRASIRKVPVYGYEAEGTRERRVAMTETKIIDYIDPHPLWNGLGELVGVRVIGEFMEPRLFEGELVIAQLNLPPVHGGDCLVEFNDGSGLVRSYISSREGEPVICRQWSPDSEVSFPRAEVRALHAVIWRR